MATKKTPSPQVETEDTTVQAMDPSVTQTVDGVTVYEPHQDNKPTYKQGDATYGHKRPCMLADGTYPTQEEQDD